MTNTNDTSFIPQNYSAATCGHLARARPRCSGSPLKCLLRVFRGSKISEILELFGKARGFKISKVFGVVGGATKNLGDFWSLGPCPRSGFPRDLSLFGCLRGCSAERIDGEPKSFRIYRLALSVHGDCCAPSSRRADSPREIKEAEGPGWMQGPRDPKSPEISNHFYLFGCLCGGSV